jgi:NAD kinase
MHDASTAVSACHLGFMLRVTVCSRRLADHIDFVVCLGGDGVILHASSLFKQHIPPVVSFHLGSMGFLTNHPYPDFRQELRQVRQCNMLPCYVILYIVSSPDTVHSSIRHLAHCEVVIACS